MVKLEEPGDEGFDEAFTDKINSHEDHIATLDSPLPGSLSEDDETVLLLYYKIYDDDPDQYAPLGVVKGRLNRLDSEKVASSNNRLLNWPCLKAAGDSCSNCRRSPIPLTIHAVGADG